MTFKPTFNIDDYATVPDRIQKFWELYPDGRIMNEIVLTNEKEVIIKCSVWKDKTTVMPDAVDYAQESIAPAGVNKLSHIENCSTSATGRAISLLGGSLSTSKTRATQHEMLKAARQREWLHEASQLFAIKDIAGLRKLHKESVEAYCPQHIVDDILHFGKELAKLEKDSPDEKETKTSGELANATSPKD